MFSKLKKGVKWIMEKKNEIVNNSFGVRLYEDIKRCLKDTFYDKDKSNQIGVMIITSGLGIGLGIGICVSSVGVGLILKNLV